ncbi:porin family protein [Aliivibrio finisterrensis]|uniref:Porin family protein n=1 Tax=Aliivibrio finisterrensis TaxID=511998 RepID=A0A4Q5KI47_9GAMM|nr:MULTISPECIES: outer membrane beta-barrel protein [Aliivibrio]MDD9176124.1 outer membrane beta-barrel protein [Aliivibrio sp. S3TY1]MDD9193268.1 outer membrane beta-barrel protein [Aliivibrio sp. S2TY2]RYU45834.1 porin family protein [Aliivibrio finisterrensis]
MKKTLLALALASVSVTAAADSLIYGGLQVGSADYAGDSSTVYGAHIGTGILPFIGLEMGAWNLGSYDVAGQTTDVTSVNFAVKPSIDFGPLHVYGKAGMHSWESKGFLKNDGVDPFFGLGVEYNILPMFTVGAGYNNFTVDDKNIDFASVNLTVHFL